MAQKTNSRRDLHAMIANELDVRLRWAAKQMGLPVSDAVAILLKEALDRRDRDKEKEQRRAHS